MKKSMMHGTRRRFLKATAVGVAAPYLVPASALGRGGAVAPSNRIAMGFIGVGDHGVARNLRGFFRQKDAQIVAVCDVDRDRRENARKLADKHHAKDTADGKYKGCAAYNDFRELVARDDIDGVQVSTPDHWHVLASLAAIRAGKDVICEKPLTLTVHEGRVLADEARKHDRITQTSSENRSLFVYHRMCELVRNGRIGTLRRIHVELPAGHSIRKASHEIQPVPDGFDYDLWLGRAPEAPYCPARCHWNFRWIFDYSGGMLTDWGAHLIDVAQWGNGTEHTGPVSVEATGEFPAEGLYNTATQFECKYAFANGVELVVSSRSPALEFEGADGTVWNESWTGSVKASDPKILRSRIGDDETRLYTCTGGEHRNFLDCVKSRRPCYAPFETGHRTITIAHIANIAMQVGRKLVWDPVKERFTGDDTANGMLRRALRKPWTL